MQPRKFEILVKNFQLYWQGQPAEISDERFDQLVEELKAENPNHPFLKKVGLSAIRGTKYIHKKPMLSLDKVYSFQDLKKWVDSIARGPEELFYVQYKFDGLAGKYVDGILSTRGDGKEGEDISRRKPNIRLITGDCKVPLVEVTAKKEIIGEIIVSYQDFEHYKEIMDRDFSNPRNFVAGMVNRKEPLRYDVKLDFVEYDQSPKKFFRAYELDSKWQSIVESMTQNCIYPTDGLVVKLDDEEYAQSLGCTEHHPRGYMAFKFYGKTAWTKLLDVLWSAGKGKLTPVAIVDPVQVGDVTISKVTMHNAKFVIDKDIRIGDDLEIERAGEVIPHVVARKQGWERKSPIPVSCPSCGEQLIYEEPELRCKNPKCHGTSFELLRSSLDCFEIDGLGSTIINSLYELGMLSYPSDIFYLTEEQLLKIPRFGERSAKKLFQSIQLAKTMTTSSFLASLNTPGVGKSMYEKVLKKVSFKGLINNPDKLFNLIASVSGIGENRATAIVKSLKQNDTYISKLLPVVTFKEAEEIINNGKTICFTGQMDHPRSYYEKFAKEKGYRPLPTVTKNLTLLVVPNKNWTSSKTRLAQKFGVQISTLEEWINA